MALNRRFGTGKLSSGNILSSEDVTPAESMTNLADVMLVLVVGLLLALITYWNVDIAASSTAVSIEQGQEVSGLAGLNSDNQETIDDDMQYEEYGVVYRNPATGKLYMVTEGE